MNTALPTALSKLDSWLESMRGPNGYTGPISHWWESNFLFTGALYDWRYEGIIDGYRELYLRTGQRVFLARARQAADDVVPHLLPNGRLRNSSFQFGPVSGGTPHEAAIASALLNLVYTLRAEGSDDYHTYFEVAEANLLQYWIGTLWNGKGFQDQTYNTALVANKHGTLLEAFLAYRQLTDCDFRKYIQACVRVIQTTQVKDGPQAGGTVHTGIGPSRLAIPIYTARAINGLITLLDSQDDSEVKASIQMAADFLNRHITELGVDWGVYGSGRLARNPQIIAGSGDVLRCLLRIQERGFAQVEGGIDLLTSALLRAQQPTGGLPTAFGFTAKGLESVSTTRELRDVLPVVGWTDKAFRALALQLPKGSTIESTEIAAYDTNVHWRGHAITFHEDAERFIIRDYSGHPCYLWIKGERAPRVCYF